MGEEPSSIEVEAMVSGRDDRPYVQVLKDGRVVLKLTPEEARQVAGKLTRFSHQVETYSLLEFVRARGKFEDQDFEVIVKEYLAWRQGK